MRHPVSVGELAGAMPTAAHLLPASHTAAIVSELLTPEALRPLATEAPPHAEALALACPLAFPLLRIRTTGAEAADADVTPTLAFIDAALGRGAPFVVLFDLRATTSLRPPPFALLRKVFAWANAAAKPWDAQVKAIGVLMSNAAVRPLLQLVTRVMNPPQPMTYCAEEAEALAFLAQQRPERDHAKVA